MCMAATGHSMPTYSIMTPFYRFCVASALLVIAPLAIATAQGPGSLGKGAVKESSNPAAIINGTRIPYEDYVARYRDQVSYQKKQGQSGEIDAAAEDAIFMQLVDNELYRQEAVRRKVNVGREEAIKLLLQNPPDFIRQSFTDPKGNFQKETFRQVVLNPNMITRIVNNGTNPDTVLARWKEDLNEVIEYVQVNETKKRLGDVLFAEKPLTEAKIRARYFAEKTKFNGSFIRVLHSTIPPDSIKVTDAEARDWYDHHQDDYRFAAARQIAALILPVDPPAADSAAHRDQIATARAAILNSTVAQRPGVVSALLRTLPPNRFPTDRPVNLGQLPDQVRDQLKNARIGDVIGPVAAQGEESLFFIDGIAPTTDTVIHARHLLIKVSQGDDAKWAEVLKLMTDLRDSIRNEDLFKEAARYYSQDNTASKDGDLGYFTRGRMIPQFDSVCFTGPVGKVIGPFRTRFGYHLVWIDEKITTGYHIRELRFPFAPSEVTRQSVLNDANAYAAALRTGIGADSIYKAIRKRYPRANADTSLLRRLDIYGDVLTTSSFAFKAKPGDATVIPLPYDRVLVAKVLQSWPTSVAPFEGIRNSYVIPHVQRKRQLEMLKPRLAKLNDSMTADMTLGIIRLWAPMAEAFVIQNQPISSPPDEDPTILDSMMEVTRNGGVSGPVRGTHAFYYLRVIEKTDAPTAADYERDRERFRADYTERYRQKLIEDAVTKARQYAEVEDLRPATRKRLGE
ncbi:MAG: Peptidylprolyl isomerase [Chlorobi bacterium]|nr:Peptidylprolyl isomerase [Chlorobiota bacterium]